MTIDRLRDALSAVGPPPDARELSEMLWLACHISPSEEAAPLGRRFCRPSPKGARTNPGSRLPRPRPHRPRPPSR
ncbi:hypothetical protein [Actinomadura madurae]|uniref:hypothetical protein n=1 Tax=Actinomadura madurae TaxID=1993 RepID=UPI0020D2135F|nr:hypothetical protein [Actinomadura madurae]MCP9950133.1 hypothetical protein [Actinomadura madurae]MCP9966896.1 hypothetical protein [Actinomadura madurae]MCP9979380.1 hypothetical protein [Actinomadura madurae]MCQ0015584.1 hypothetical protein [Actinomadura madurae]